MKVNWVIEKGLFVDTKDRLMESLSKQGISYKTLQYIPFDEDLVSRCEKLFPDKESCVIFHGSLNFGRKLKKLSWIPGV